MPHMHASYVCLTCMPNRYALYVCLSHMPCLIRMPYECVLDTASASQIMEGKHSYACLYECLICMPCINAPYVCLVCMHAPVSKIMEAKYSAAGVGNSSMLPYSVLGICDGLSILGVYACMCIYIIISMYIIISAYYNYKYASMIISIYTICIFYANLLCIPYMYCLYACLTCMPYMSALCQHQRRLVADLSKTPIFVCFCYSAYNAQSSARTRRRMFGHYLKPPSAGRIATA